MTLEAISRNEVRVALTADDMKYYHISFDSMNAADAATRNLLDDMLAVMKHMGMRCFGDRVSVECQRHGSGGCALLLTVIPPVRWLFASDDDLFFALRSGALPRQQCAISKAGSGWLLTPKCRLSSEEAALLAEFSTRYTAE